MNSHSNQSWCGFETARGQRPGVYTHGKPYGCVGIIDGMDFPSSEIQERFWDSIEKTRQDDCWEWNGTVMGAGYGTMSINGTTVYAHRLAYRLTHGEIEGQVVRHRCNNRSCCNPSHLTEGDHSDNMKDAADVGTLSDRPQNFKRGEENPGAKLTEADVAEIRLRLEDREETFQEIGDAYGVSKATIHQIKSGKTWSE